VAAADLTIAKKRYLNYNNDSTFPAGRSEFLLEDALIYEKEKINGRH
jgi:hypothetical protein